MDRVRVKHKVDAARRTRTVTTFRFRTDESHYAELEEDAYKVFDAFLSQDWKLLSAFSKKADDGIFSLRFSNMVN